MANSRHNKYVSVTDWFSTPTSASGATDAATGTGVATSGASFAGGSWGSGGGGGGSNITIIKTNDTTPESNSNVYSALRVHNNFIAKDKDERTTGKLASDVGFEVGEFVSGSSGALLYIDPDNYQTTAELDRLYVRVKAYFETLEIVNVNSVGGKQLISPAGSVRCYGVETTGTREIITEVQSTDEDGNLLYDENGNPIMETVVEYVDNGVPEGVYRCYFLAEQDGQKVENRFHVNDQAYSQTFNVSEGTSSQVGNRYYWRLVTGVSTDMVEFDGKQCHYIDLSILDCDVDSDVPQAEDIICHRGSRTESDRQNVLEFSAVDNFSPSITLYQGIGIDDPDNDLYPYSLVGKDVVSYGVNQSTNLAFMNVYGNMYIGDRNGDQFLRFDDVSGLTIKANLDIGTKFGGDDLTLEERIELAAKAYEEDVNAFKDAVEKDLESIQNQIDGAIETYFYDPEPTLNNPPASNWDDTDKANHVGDLYYSGKGKAYRFQYDETNGYYWNIITDTDITLALANAKKAQDTADSKRKIFTERPATNDTYDIGDMWANANYTDATHSYSNDLLRAVTAKAAGTVFSIDHWTLASKYTDDTFAQAAKAAADAAQLAADNALADASAANQRLNSWAADGSISPTEKQGIKEEWARVIADRDHIVSEYEKYELGTPTDYNNAYTPYIENLIALFQPTPENITIPSDFDDNQTAYYELRTIALGVISLAAKKLADDAQTAADNALKEAEAALNAAEEAKQSVYDLNQDVTEFKNYTDGAFADNILSSSERSTIKDYIYQINTTKALVDESYSEVINNTFLVGSTEETNLKNGYNTFNTATNKLLSFISSITDGYRDENGNVIIENLDRAQFESNYNQFNSTYSDYTKYLHAATKFIEYAINSRVDTTLEALGGYSYLKNALNASTTITGGLVLTTMIALGYYDDNQEYNVMAGINGSCKTDDDITIWAGGSNVDKTLYPNDPQAADFLVRADGTGYAAGGNFWWESDGTIHADPLSFVVSESSVGALLASFWVDFDTVNGKPVPHAIKPLATLYDVTFAGDIKLQDEARLGIGDIYLSYDKTNNAMCFTRVDGTPVNFYTTGGISMYGQGDTTVTSITDVIEQMLDPNTLEINDEGLLTVIGGTSGGGTADAVAWENITGKPSFATVATSGSYNDLLNKPTLLSSFTNDVGYLTEHQDLSGYQTKITSSAKLAASLVSGLATVATSGSYNDLSNKPTIPTSLKNPYALSWSGYSSGSYDGSAAKSITIPTNTNQLTNGAGFITSSGSITGSSKILKFQNLISSSTINIWNGGYSTLQIHEVSQGKDVPTNYPFGYLHNYRWASTQWSNQLYFSASDYESRLFTRGYRDDTDTWTSWNTVAFLSDIDSKLSGYLPLSGGTITGGRGVYSPLIVKNSLSEVWIQLQDSVGSAYIGTNRGVPSIYLGSGSNMPILHSGNYSSYALPLTGGTLTGRLAIKNSLAVVMATDSSSAKGISWKNAGDTAVIGSIHYHNTGQNFIINPTGASDTWSDALGKYSLVIGNNKLKYNTYTVYHSGNLTKLSQLTNDSGFITSSASISGNAATATKLQDYKNNSGEITLVKGTRTDGTKERRIYDNGWTLDITNNGISGQIASVNHNVASATKLATARTIWGQSFDGSADVSGGLTDVSSIQTTGAAPIYLYRDSNKNGHYIVCDHNGFGISKCEGQVWKASCLNINYDTNNVAIGQVANSYKLHVNGTLNATTIYQNGSSLNSLLGNYLPLSGGTLSGMVKATSSFGLIMANDNSYAIGLRWYKTDKTTEIGSIIYHNASQRFIINSIGSSAVYEDALGKYSLIVGNNELTYNTYKIWHSGNDGSGSGLDADTLDGKHYSDIINGNVASATKLQTPRTIWGQSFDGTGNVSGVFRLITAAGDGAAYHKILKFPESPYGLITRIYDVGSVSLQVQRESNDSECFNLLLNPLGGNVGIGTTTPGYKLHVAGTAYISSNLLTGGGITMYSARVLKNVVDERGLSLRELSVIKPTRYTWKDKRDERLHIGGIADDIEQVLPEVVYRTNDGVLTMDYGNAAFAIASSLIKPMIEHESEIVSLKRKVRELEEEVKRLRA